MTDLLHKYGSYRRLLEAYWLGELSPQEERHLENEVPKNQLSDFKPVVFPPRFMPVSESLPI